MAHECNARHHSIRLTLFCSVPYLGSKPNTALAPEHKETAIMITAFPLSNCQSQMRKNSRSQFALIGKNVSKRLSRMGTHPRIGLKKGLEGMGEVRHSGTDQSNIYFSIADLCLAWMVSGTTHSGEENTTIEKLRRTTQRKYQRGCVIMMLCDVMN